MFFVSAVGTNSSFNLTLQSVLNLLKGIGIFLEFKTHLLPKPYPPNYSLKNLVETKHQKEILETGKTKPNKYSNCLIKPFILRCVMKTCF